MKVLHTISIKMNSKPFRFLLNKLKALLLLLDTLIFWIPCYSACFVFTLHINKLNFTHSLI